MLILPTPFTLVAEPGITGSTDHPRDAQPIEADPAAARELMSMGGVYGTARMLLLLLLCLTTPTVRGNWTYVNGPNAINQNGVYGEEGVPAEANQPGARLSLGMVEAGGQLFIFGGFGLGKVASGPLNDMWVFNTTSKVWTWLGGSDVVNQIGVYGVKGVPAEANQPGARYNLGLVEVGAQIFLFGGTGWDSTGSQGHLNDLWVFNTTSKMWTWIAGSDAKDQIGVYGVEGVPAEANQPGARYNMGLLEVGGQIFLFGGFGCGMTSTKGRLNDLWVFNTTSKIWTWLGGSRTINQIGVYGVKGVPAEANQPGARYYMKLVEVEGQIFLFGGNGCGSTSTKNALNDLWVFNTTSKMWTWLGGSDLTNRLGVYGVKGVPAEANQPGARYGMGMVETGGQIFLFGGHFAITSNTNGRFNDLWVFNTTSKVWTWLAGSDVKDQLAVYGEEGVPAEANTPGAMRYMSMLEAGGQIFLFGGFGYLSSGSAGTLADIWSWDLGDSAVPPTDDEASIVGDPHFVGFDGSRYDFQGIPGGVFNIITDNNFQMNAKFVLAPNDGQTYMGELSIISSGNRVLLTPLSTKLNGKKVQDVVICPFGPGWMKIEGLTTVVSTQGFTITITVENVESFLYLNVGAKVEAASLHDPHGLLGQTAHFLIVQEKPKPVVLSHKNKNAKGFIDGSPTDYLVSDGIFGTQFRFNRFSDTPSKKGKSRSKKLKHVLKKAGRRTFVVAHTEAIFPPRSIHGRN